MADDYRCPFCGQWFVVPSLLQDHIQTEHGKQDT